MESYQGQSSHSAMPLLHQWLQLSEAETRSIQADDWGELDRIQNAKAVLQSQLSKSDTGDYSNEIREMADILISIEAENSHVLECKLNELQNRMNDDSKSLSNMNNVQNAYSHASLNSRHSISRLEQLT